MGTHAATAEESRASSGEPTVVAAVDPATWSRLTLLPRVVAPADPVAGHALVDAALRAPGSATVSAAVVGSTAVGLAVSGLADARDGSRELLALGVAPGYRRRGIAATLLRAHAAPGSYAVVTLAERDVFEPMSHDVRASVARRLLEGAGFTVEPAEEIVRSIDPLALMARRR
jgi:ribosomal protein S18 acetylase RimI-like enzyme